MKPGIYTCISNKDYHAGPGISKSNLVDLMKSAAHYKHKKENPKPATPAMDFGSAFHALILEPDEYKRIVKVNEFDGRTNAGKAFKDSLTDEDIVLSVEQKDHLTGMQKSLESSEVAASLLKCGKAEESFFWEDTSHGFLCKCRTDYRREDLQIAIDIKTCQDAKDFVRSCALYHYDMQAAWYQAGLLNTTGEMYDFIFIAVEKTPPYGVMVYNPDQTFYDNGRNKIRPVLDMYKKCLDTETWPSYEDKIHDLQLPGWAMV